MYENFIKMPIILKIAVGAAVLIPALSVLSILSGGILPKREFNSMFGAAGNISELVVVLICTIPVVVGAILILKKSPKSKTIYFFGWVIVCVSPLALDSIRQDIDQFLPQLIFNLILGIALMGYLNFGGSAVRYFTEKNK